jgi:membrane-bound lytic murein transglycosylase D
VLHTRSVEPVYSVPINFELEVGMNKTIYCRIPFILAVTFAVFLCCNKAYAQIAVSGTEDDSLFVPPLTYEYIPDATYDQIEERLKKIEGVIPLNFNTRVKSFVDYFTVRDREYTKMVLRRSTYYFPIFEPILEKYGLPDELKYLAIVESGLNSTVRSWAAAVGLWQFIYYTGKTYGLHADWYVDERMDPVKSTEAAARYIKSLYSMFGDWELALAAYNCGPGNVRKAIRRSGYKRKFWDVYRYLPRETRGYVPQFVAIAYTFQYQEEHNLMLEDHEYIYPISTDTIMVKNFLNLSTLGEMLDICPEQMEFLNPAIKRKAVPKSSKYFSVRIPADKMSLLTENRISILDSASKTGQKELEYLARNSVGSTYGRDKIVHRVRSGDVLSRIAQTYHVRVSDIKKWNSLSSNTIRVGQKLNIWLVPNSYSEKLALKKPTVKQEMVVDGKRYHIVQPGDTLWDISKAYNDMSIEKLKKLNNLKSNNIKPGQKLVIG